MNRQYLVILDLNNCISTIIHLTKDDIDYEENADNLHCNVVHKICDQHNVHFKDSECSWAFSNEIIFQ